MIGSHLYNSPMKPEAFSYPSCAEYLRAKGKLIDGPTRVYPEERREWSMAEIKAMVCGKFRVFEYDIDGPHRHRDIARPRQVAMYLCRYHTHKSLPQIGRCFGDRDHTTVVHALRTISALRQTDAELNGDIRALEKALGSPVRGREARA